MSKGSRSRKRREREQATTPSEPHVALQASSAEIATQPTVPEPAPPQNDEPFSAEVHEDEFFARGDDIGSIAPSSFDPEFDLDEPEPERHRADVVMRRARFRKIATWVVGAAFVLTVPVMVKGISSRRAAREYETAMTHSDQVVASITITPAEEEQEPVRMASASEPTRTPPVPFESGSPRHTASEPAASAPAQAPVVPPPTKAEARKLIERGRMHDGITAARAAIDADPTDAETYLLLGAALQETGQWRESSAVFARCLKRATRGPTQECRALKPQ